MAAGGPTEIRSPKAPARLALARLGVRVSPGLAAACVVLTTVLAALEVGGKIVFGILVDEASRAAAAPGDAVGRPVLVALGVTSITFLAQQSLPSLHDALAGILGARIDGSIRTRVLGAVLGPPSIAHLEDPEVLDLVRTAHGLTDGFGTPGAGFGALLWRLRSWLQTIGSMVIVGAFDVRLAALLLATALLVRSSFWWRVRRSSRAHVDQAGRLRRSSYLQEMLTAPAAAKEVRILGLPDWVAARQREQWRVAMAHIWQERSRGWQRVTAAMLGLSAAFFVALVVAGRAAIRGEMTVGELTAVGSAALSFISTASLSGHDFALAEGLEALPALQRLEQVAAEIALDDGDQSADDLPREAIRFEGVGFTYPGGSRVFESLDLSIPAGRSLAIVGVNGAGKTTLVKLLARLVEPSTGRITVDGEDLRRFHPRSWQRRVAAIFQDFVRYELSVADNVALADDPVLRADAVDHALSRAGAAGLVTRLPAGVDTILSKQYDGGVDLSGGEWQRVALARALHAVGAGAGVLILDEPTAALDVRAEAELFDRFLELTAGVTSIVISHRFSTVRNADRIVVLEGGRVVESGTHEELLAAAGRYAHMFELQARRFADDADTDTDTDAETDEPEPEPADA